MRKGRSQRKTRGSLSPTSKRPLSRPNAAASGGSSGPQVVVGLTAPRSEESLATLDTRSGEAERLELVREQSLEIVRESLELVRESLELQEQETEPQAEQEPQPEQEQPVEARVETLTFTAPDSFADVPDATSEEASVQATASPAPTRQMKLPTPDEMSIPPVGDIEVEPIADRFFSEGELVAARGIHEHEEWDERAHKSVRKSLPEVVQRRARFAKYVRWAVGGSAVLCLAALVRTVIPTPAPAGSASLAALESREQPAAKAAAAAAVAAEPVKAPESVAAPVVAVPVAAPVAAEPVAEPAKAAEPEPVKASEPTAAAPASTTAPTTAPATPAADAPAVAVSDKTALQEKNDSRRALERGKLGDAIAAGERSVALDPTDGEAWLLLGAAYQEKGKNADARRCYSACVKEGKRGPVGECRAMIR